MKRSPLLIFYTVAFLFSGLCETLYILSGANALLAVVTLFLASYGPTVGTLVALALLHNAEETHTWRRRLLTQRANWRWYVLSALLPAAVWLVGTGLTALFFGGHFPFRPLFFAATPFLLLANGGEEVGWRGFALPRLLTRFKSLTASLLLGVLWSLIHLPLYLQTLLLFLPFLFLLTALSILMTWIFNHTGSVLLMVVMHASLDVTTNFVAPPNQTVSAVAVFALSALVMWLIAFIVLLRTGPDLGRTGNRGVPTLDQPLPAQAKADD